MLNYLSGKRPAPRGPFTAIDWRISSNLMPGDQWPSRSVQAGTPWRISGAESTFAMVVKSQRHFTQRPRPLREGLSLPMCGAQPAAARPNRQGNTLARLDTLIDNFRRGGSAGSRRQSSACSREGCFDATSFGFRPSATATSLHDDGSLDPGYYAPARVRGRLSFVAISAKDDPPNATGFGSDAARRVQRRVDLAVRVDEYLMPSLIMCSE